MDEARFGQQGTLTRVWAPRNSRPTAVKQTRYEWVYLYGAADPATGDATALLLRHVGTASMNAFLEVFSRSLGPDEHAVLVMDNAGWHHAKALRMPANVTPLYLPPYSPELNPIERLWGYLKSHYLSNRAYETYEDLLEAPLRSRPEVVVIECRSSIVRGERRITPCSTGSHLRKVVTNFSEPLVGRPRWMSRATKTRAAGRPEIVST